MCVYELLFSYGCKITYKLYVQIIFHTLRLLNHITGFGGGKAVKARKSKDIRGVIFPGLISHIRGTVSLQRSYNHN